MRKLDPVITINGEVHVSVEEFARVTKRYTNHIYQLINVGNAQRKLRHVRHKVGFRLVTYIPEAEVLEFPFTAAGSNESRLEGRLQKLEDRVDAMEDSVNSLERNL